MTYGKLVWLVCGVTLATFFTGISSGYAAEIPSPFIEKDYESCLAQGAAGQEEFQTRYCRCFVDRMQDGMDFEEYILVASGFDLENMSNEELVKKAMSNDKINSWVQECLKIFSPYLK